MNELKPILRNTLKNWKKFSNTFQKQAIQQMGEKSIWSMFTNPTSSNTQTRKPPRYYFTWIEVKFLKTSLATFWTQLITEFWELSKQALKILMSFSATHLHRTEFSFIIVIMINNQKGGSAQFEKWTYSSTISVTDISYIENNCIQVNLFALLIITVMIFCVTMSQY